MIVAIQRATAVGASKRLHPAALVLVNFLQQAKEAPAVFGRKGHNRWVSVLDKQRLPLRIVWFEIREGSRPLYLTQLDHIPENQPRET